MSAPSSMSSPISTQRLAGVGRVHLVAAPVAELRRAVRGLAERSVERGGVLGGVGHDGRVLEALVVQLAPDGRDAPVHHVRRGDDVGAGLGVGGGGAGEKLQAHVVEDLAGILLHDPAVAVARVLAQAHVRHDQQLGDGVLYGAGGELHDALRVVGARLAASSFSSGSPKSSTPGIPSEWALFGLLRRRGLWRAGRRRASRRPGSLRPRRRKRRSGK